MMMRYRRRAANRTSIDNLRRFGVSSYRRILLAILYGIIASYLVALGCIAMWDDPLQSGQFFISPLDPVKWPREVPDEWGAMGSFADWSDESAFGMRSLSFFSSDRLPPYDTGSERRSGSIQLAEAGWPFRCMSYEVWEQRTSVRPSGGRWQPGHDDSRDIPSQTVWLNGITVESEIFGFGSNWQKRIPLRPIWFRFGLNVAFWGFVLTVLFGIPGTIQRALRHRRNLCEQCG